MTDNDVPAARPDTEHYQESGSVSVLTSGSRVRVVLSGPIDAAMKAELAEAFRGAERHQVPIEVDTRTVSFMDSTAVAQIAHTANRLPGRLVFIQPPEVVRFLLDLTHVDEMVDVLNHDPGFPES
ncbi:hypothetical protein GCM10023169_01390 [Georgenia halophila]|uniref:STAS domain-containing protein n=1 Tax=Georgenia halophila TaxID=620889 RepID=A0ABP8KT72_9MICO